VAKAAKKENGKKSGRPLDQKCYAKTTGIFSKVKLSHETALGIECDMITIFFFKNVTLVTG
jgi:hypothetical protein